MVNQSDGGPRDRGHKTEAVRFDVASPVPKQDVVAKPPEENKMKRRKEKLIINMQLLRAHSVGERFCNE